MMRSGVVKVTRTSSVAGARVAVREAFGSAARAWSEIERCAEATLSIRFRQAFAREASAGVGATPIKTAAHAAAIAPSIRGAGFARDGRSANARSICGGVGFARDGRSANARSIW